MRKVNCKNILKYFKTLLKKVISRKNNIDSNGKNIFQICINLNDNIKELKEHKKKLIKNNPGWNYVYVDSENLFKNIMVENFKESKNYFDKKIYKCFEEIKSTIKLNKKFESINDLSQKAYIENIQKLVSQTDLFRLAMIYKFGGLYLDLSSSANLNIEEELSFYDVVLIKNNKEVRTSFIYARKGDRLIKHLLGNAIENCLVNRESSQYILAGPAMYTKSINELTKGKFIFENKKWRIFHEPNQNFFVMDASWKTKLHTSDPEKPEKEINKHWLKPTY